MSFPRAKIQRFNETPSCSPAPGTYDPKLLTTVKAPTMRKDSKQGSEGDLIHGILKPQCPTVPSFRTPQLPRKAVKVTSGKTLCRERTDSSSSADDILIRGREISSSCPDLTELESLKHKLKNAVEEINKSKDLCEMLNKDIAMKMTQIEELQQSNEVLALEIGSLQKELEEAQNKHQESLSEFETIDRATLTHIHEIHCMVCELLDKKDLGLKEMSNLRIELDSLGNLKHDLEQKVCQKQQMILMLQSELSSAEVELVECRSECERMNAAAAERCQEIESLKNTIKDLEQKMDDTDKQLRDMRDNLMNGSVVRENLEEQLMEKQAEFLALEANYSNLLSESKSLKTQHAGEIEEVMQNYDAQLGHLVNNFELASNITNLNTSHFKNICEEKLLVLEGSIESVITKTQGLCQNEISRLKQDVIDTSHRLKEQQAIAEKKIEFLSSEMERRDVESVKRIKEVESEARIITEKLLRAEEQLKKVNDIKDDLKISDVENKITIVELQDKIDLLTTENATVSDMLSAVVGERDSLKLQNKKLTVGNRNLSESLEALRIRLLESETDVEELTIMKNMLQSERDNLKLDLEKKLQELDNHRKNMAKMEAENLEQIEKVRTDLLEKIEAFKQKALARSESFEKIESEKQLQIQDLSSQLAHFRSEFDELNKYVSAMEEENKSQSQQLEIFQRKQTELEKSYATLTSSFNLQEMELNKLSNELLIASKTISSQEEQILEYKCQLKQLSTDLETSELRSVELNEALTVAEESSAEHEREIEALTEKLDHQRDCAKVANQQIATLEARKSYQDHQIQTLTSELERHKEFSHQATEHMLSLVNSNTEKETMIEALTGDIEEFKNNIQEANVKLKDLKTQLLVKQSKLQESLEEIKLLEGDRFVKEEQLKELTSELECYRKHESQCVENINILEHSKLEKESELHNLELKIIAMEEERIATDEYYKNLIVDLEESIQKNNINQENLLKEIAETKNFCSNLKNVKTDLELEIHELKRNCDTLESSLSHEKAKNEEYISEISKMEYEFTCSQSQGMIVQQNYDKQQRQIEVLETEVKELSLQLNKKQREMDDTVAKLKEQLHHSQRNLERISKLEQESLDWQKRYLEVESLIGPFKEQLEAYRAECKLLEDQKGEVMDDMRELALQYAATLGHQNHKQKIRYLVKLKDQNLELKEEVRTLKRALEKVRKESATSSGKPSVTTHTVLVSKGKENMAHNGSPVRKSPVASPNPKPFADRPAHKNVI